MNSFFFLNLIIYIFEPIELLNSELQKNELCINLSHQKVTDVKKIIEEMRNEDFDLLWERILEEAKKLDINEPKLKVPRRRNKKYDSSTKEFTFDEPKTFYRKIFYEIIDTVVMSERYRNETMTFLNECENFVIGKDANLKKIVD